MRIVVVGLGNQGRKRLRIAGDDVVGTVDPYNAEAEYRSVEEVPLDTYDATLVCTSDESKLSILEYLLARGKHVLVEKPLLTTDGNELKQLQELAEDNGAVCYTAYNHRFEPHIVRLKEILDSERLGSVYSARFFYGNGTAREVRDSWRDQGMGVLADLGSHLLDIVIFLFGRSARHFEAWSLGAYENRAYDHVHLGSQGIPSLQLQATLLSWRNSFTVDIIGENGSAHMDCLCKWGPSTLTVRERVLPSGKPDEERFILECSDPTWEVEYRDFKERCRSVRSNIDNDIWINEVLHGVIQDSREVPV
jgi:scyllo-inositol 2-dehydrogenase (NADP+)